MRRFRLFLIRRFFYCFWSLRILLRVSGCRLCGSSNLTTVNLKLFSLRILNELKLSLASFLNFVDNRRQEEKIECLTRVCGFWKRMRKITFNFRYESFYEYFSRFWAFATLFQSVVLVYMIGWSFIWIFSPMPNKRRIIKTLDFAFTSMIFPNTPKYLSNPCVYYVIPNWFSLTPTSQQDLWKTLLQTGS